MEAETPQDWISAAVERLQAKDTALDAAWECPWGEKHQYARWEQNGTTGTAVCAKCGHRAIDGAHRVEMDR